MSTDLLNILKEVQKLPIKERRELADLLLEDLEKVQNHDNEVQSARAIVAETSGFMAGLDRATLIRLAEDEEFSGY